MHAKGFLHKLLSSVMYKKHLDSLIVLVMSLLVHKQLSVTGLGRGINLPIQENSCIRRSDRFIGNKLLGSMLGEIYKQYIANLLGAKKRPKFIVDWTHVPNTRLYVLRAALAAKGRALTLYEEVHVEKNYGTVTVESNFLNNLAKLLPNDCIPIVITDAGYRNPWFKQILKLGWDFVGRIRGTHKYYDGVNWRACTDLYENATRSGRSTGTILLCKKNTISASLCVTKADAKQQANRKQYKRKIHCKKDIESYRRSANEPWLLATSLQCKNAMQIKRVNKIYKLRMQIEEGFRDLKNPRYGFGLRHAHSRSVERVQILFLLAMFACFIAWLTGYVAEMNKWHYQFQSNSIKNRRVVSLFFLGCQIIRRGIKMPKNTLIIAIQDINGLES